MWVKEDVCDIMFICNPNIAHPTMLLTIWRTDNLVVKWIIGISVLTLGEVRTLTNMFVVIYIF